VLYLDSDTIVTRSLNELFEIELGDKLLAAAKVIYGLEDRFNSGVLLVNNKLWKEENIQATLIEITDRDHETLPESDQTVFNRVAGGRYIVLDDTYNANVDSLQAAIDVLKGYDAFRILLVGDMKELGEDSLKCHQQVGEHAKQAKLDLVLSYGTESAVISEAVLGKHFTDKAELTAYALDIIKQKLQENQKVVVLAKGSRSMKMEETIYSLKDSLC